MGSSALHTLALAYWRVICCFSSNSTSTHTGRNRRRERPKGRRWSRRRTHWREAEEREGRWMGGRDMLYVSTALHCVDVLWFDVSPLTVAMPFPQADGDRETHRIY